MSWREHIQVHPAADLFPMMGEAELRELGEDIKAHGQQHPVILLRDGEQIWLLDGRNRLDAMELVGLPMLRKGGHWDRTYDRDFLFEEIEADGAFDPYAYVVSANIRRRHLTGADRDDLVRKVKAARPELSVRAVAEITNTPKSTVARALADPSPVPSGTPAERVTGKDGKSYPAHKPGTGQVHPEGSPKAAAPPVDGQAFLHKSNRPLVEIKVLARNEWQTKALAEDPTNPEEAVIRYNAIGWETGAIEQRVHELHEAEGRVLEDAKRFFPGGRGWSAWVKSQKTCLASAGSVNTALAHVGYRPDGRPDNTITRLNTWFNKLCREDDPRLNEIEAAVERLMAEFGVVGADSGGEPAPQDLVPEDPAPAAPMPETLPAVNDAAAPQLVPEDQIAPADHGQVDQLVDLYAGLKTNTQKVGRAWVECGRPSASDPTEHHVITQALLPFRAMAVKLDAAGCQAFLSATAP